MGNLTLNGATSGQITIAPPSVAGTNTLSLPATTGTVIVGTQPSGAIVGTTDTQTLTNKTLTSPTINSPTIGGTPVMGASVITSGTAQASTSGANIDFTGIPSWVKRITVMFNGVSTSGSNSYQIQIGTISGFETTGYAGATANLDNAASVSAGNNSTGFRLNNAAIATMVNQGIATIALIGSNTWAFSSQFGRSDIASLTIGAGAKTLSATLDRVRITTVGGTDTFDAGSINILYE